ncbi:type II toxin-antitoxin system HipA family toxin [Desulfobacula sp.]|uniref:type II toxin-antitoxin system HipA family toxin n=1 Tax=Desulfobacula sp. TaxID=2593537 RepID=UPI0025B80F01|nr:type II toxin-antitoxin system HipA family toxin [Desulfobacula sp.]MBC2704942.1 type II toxin-antitoxin system HipA family toxin [Desulfobacula sp.]
MKELNVFFYRTKNDKFIVGKLARFRNKIYFEYDPSFLANPLWLSPYKLPPEPGLHEHKETKFGPIFGLFDDSLPDGWGLLLMDRFLRNRGIDVDRLSVLDRLAFLGKSTMGALTYEPAVKHKKNDTLIDLQSLAEQSGQIIEGHSTDVLPVLMRTGGSPGGARPKILAGVNKDTIISGEDDLPENYEHWIIKFNSKNNFQDSGAVEYAYSLMAKNAGIIMPETRLFKAGSGDHFFGVKRFDRKENQRYHVHTFGNLIHSNFRIPDCNYGTFLKVVLDLTKNHQELIKGFRQMVFNIMANNRDDHVKNFAFMMDASREWLLTPAYDLTYAKGPGGEHSMDVSGEGLSPGRPAVIQLGRKSGLSTTEINHSIEQVMTAVKKWPEYAHIAGVTEKTMNYIQKRMNRNISLFL